MTGVAWHEARSGTMGLIRGSNTQPELIVRNLLHRAGFRFHHHCPDLHGRPEIEWSRHGVCVLARGSLWHPHTGHCFADALHHEDGPPEVLDHL